MNKATSKKSIDYNLLRAIFSVIITSFVLSFFFKSTQNASTKPFNTFEEFYPFYISQHQDIMCRRLHFIGTSLVFLISLFDPYVFPSLLLAATLGYGVFNATKSMENGLVEMLVTLGTFQFFMKRLSGSWIRGLFIPIMAYSFAWFGHFYFEQNRPATFVYPIYSLAGDFRLWFEIASGQRQF